MNICEVSKLIWLHFKSSEAEPWWELQILLKTSHTFENWGFQPGIEWWLRLKSYNFDSRFTSYFYFHFLFFYFFLLLLLSYPTPALENAVWAFSRERMMAGYEKLHFLWSTSCFFSPRRYIAKLLFRINRVNDAESFWNVESFKQIVLLWSDRQCSTCCMYLVQKVTIWTGCAKMVALNQPLD